MWSPVGLWCRHLAGWLTYLILKAFFKPDFLIAVRDLDKAQRQGA